MNKQQNNLLEKNDIIFEKYKIDDEYATGGMNSFIYIGHNLRMNIDKISDSMNRNVIIKIVKRLSTMKTHNWVKFCEELVTASRVDHPNLVKTYDVTQPTLTVKKENGKITTIDNIAVIVMEYVDGPSLRILMNRKKYFSIEEAMYYFKKIVLGVNRLHNYSHIIIHRDLKPENILLTSDLSDLKIVDFGISSSITYLSSKKITLTDEKSLFGTVDYMSPDNLEQILEPDGTRKRMQPSPQFDFHSLGVILFEMLTGEKPFIKDGKDDKKTIRKALFYDMPIMSSIRVDIPNSIENIVFRCIASKPEDLKFRYTSSKELLDDINSYNLPEKYNAELLKPFNKRIFEKNDMFNPLIEKSKESKIFSNFWFWLWTILSVVIGAIVIIMFVMR